ncbi:MAG: hypothetical protein K8R79_03100 [Calditrichales bacterium]|nr:hypothetical protein [Calditrichales bacterium]
MKKLNKNILLIGLSLSVGILILLLSSMTQIGNPNGAKQKYSAGRDTYKKFGDGHIQVVWTGSNSKYLWDCENQKILLNPVNLWVKKGNMIFFEGLRDKTPFIVKYALDENRIYLYEK